MSSVVHQYTDCHQLHGHKTTISVALIINNNILLMSGIELILVTSVSVVRVALWEPFASRI